MCIVQTVSRDDNFRHQCICWAQSVYGYGTAWGRDKDGCNEPGDGNSSRWDMQRALVTSGNSSVELVVPEYVQVARFNLSIVQLEVQRFNWG